SGQTKADFRKSEVGKGEIDEPSRPRSKTFMQYMFQKKLFITPLLLLIACGPDYLPKPKGFNRIDIPEHDYTVLTDDLPYQFEYSLYSQVEPDSFNLDEKDWVNLNYKELEAKVHLTYKPVNGNQENLKA